MDLVGDEKEVFLMNQRKGKKKNLVDNGFSSLRVHQILFSLV